MQTEIVKTRCWRCDGKGWRYSDFIDAMFGYRSKCLECLGSGVIFRRAPIIEDLS